MIQGFLLDFAEKSKGRSPSEHKLAEIRAVMAQRIVNLQAIQAQRIPPPEDFTKDEAPECPICTEVFSGDKRESIVLPCCRQRFHFHCLAKSITMLDFTQTTALADNICPFCRQLLSITE